MAQKIYMPIARRRFVAYNEKILIVMKKEDWG